MKRFRPAHVPSVPPPKNVIFKVTLLFRDPRVRVRFEVGLVAGLAAGLLLSVILFFGILNPVEPQLTDLIYQPIQPSGHVAIIAIDQKSLDQIGPWPWPLTVHVGLLDRLSVGGPRVIAFDVPFTLASPGQAAFAGAIQKSGNVILSTEGIQSAGHQSRPDAFPQFDMMLLPTADLASSAQGLGHRLLIPDPDGVLRRVPVAIETPDTREPALGIAAAQAYMGVKQITYDLAQRRVIMGSVTIQTDESGQMLLNFTVPRAGVELYSYSDVLAGLIPISSFAGKIVMIGGTAGTEQVTFATPINGSSHDANNVIVEAGLADMIVSSPPLLLQRDDPLNQIVLTILVALVAGLTLPHLRPLTAAALTILYLLLLILLAFQLFTLGFILRVVYPASALVLTFGGVATFRYLSEERRRQFLTILFRRYVPADSVAHVVDAVDRGELPLTGTRRKVTVLYADLRGFSTLSEGLAPEAVLEFVNSYLELMLREIQLENGTVNKPMGDALVAIWNAPLDQQDHAARAIRAAINIRRSILRFQKERADDRSLNIGLGLATGYAVLGNISALGKVEYTLVGDTVNVASRISAFAGTNQILADAATAEAGPEQVEKRELTPVRIRGRKDPLPVWEIKDSAGIVSDEDDELEDYGP